NATFNGVEVGRFLQTFSKTDFVRPSPFKSYASPRRGPKSVFEYVCRNRPTSTPLIVAFSDATTNRPVEMSKFDCLSFCSTQGTYTSHRSPALTVNRGVSRMSS